MNDAPNKTVCYDVSDTKIDVLNYFDRYAEVTNNKIKHFSLKILKDKFPNVDEFTLSLWQKEWIEAREVMLNIKF